MSEIADQLREAAKLLRQRSEAVQHFASPWRSVPKDGGSDQWLVGYNTDHPLAGLIATTPDYGQDFLPDFIATMHPVFALAVAEWLETEIVMERVRGNSEEGQTFHALKVARAVLAVQGCTAW